MTAPLAIHTSRHGHIWALTLAGHLDLHTGTHLAAALAVIPRRRAVILDLAGITFCDCAGYRALAAAKLELACRGMVHVTGTPLVVERIAGLGRPPLGSHGRPFAG